MHRESGAEFAPLKGRGKLHRGRCRPCTPLFLWSCQRKSAVHRGERNRFLPQILALTGFGLLVYGGCWLGLLPASSSQAPDHSQPPLAISRSLRCSSSSHATRFAGLAWEPCGSLLPAALHSVDGTTAHPQVELRRKFEVVDVHSLLLLPRSPLRSALPGQLEKIRYSTGAAAAGPERQAFLRPP